MTQRDGTEVWIAYDGAGRAHDLWAGKDNAGDSTVNGDEIRLVTTYDLLGRPIQEARTIEVSSSPGITVTLYEIKGSQPGAILAVPGHGAPTTIFPFCSATASVPSMARLARVVIPDLPHHVTQRGNYRQTVFFDDADYAFYRDIVAAAAKRAHVQIWSWCLMPNHIHYIMTPADPDGLRRTFAEAHRLYAARIHARFKLTGHLWQGRFSSTVMDERHLMAAARYVPMNPVAAGIVAHAEDWPWSSAKAHITGIEDGVTTLWPLAELVGDFAALLACAEQDEAALRAIRLSRTTGRPVGSAEWLAGIEARTARALAPGKRGRKPRKLEDIAQDSLFHTVSP